MKSRLALALFSVLLVAFASFAHGDKVHVMGTLDKVSNEAVIVKTKDGRSVEVKLASSTVYMTAEGKSAALGDLKPGMLVVIHATPKAKDLIADEVKFSVAETGHPARS